MAGVAPPLRILHRPREDDDGTWRQRVDEGYE